MQLPVVIEPAPDRSGYTARLAAPFDLSASAPTAEAARRSLASLLQRRMEEGIELRVLNVPAPVNGTAGGWLPDDELTRDWLGAVEDYRAECDAADRAVGPCRAPGRDAIVSLFLLETDHLTLYPTGHAQDLQNAARHLTDQLAIGAVTVEE